MTGERSFIDLPFQYAVGAGISRPTVKTVAIGSGQVRSQGNEFDIVVPNLTINALANGANGLDTGSLVANTWYFVHVIYDNTLNLPTAGLLTSSLAPILPFNYSNYRRVGWVLTDGSANFLNFTQAVNGASNNLSARVYQWDTPIQVLNGGNSNSFATVNLLPGVPYGRTGLVTLSLLFKSTTTTDGCSIKPTGSPATLGGCSINCTAAGNTIVYPNIPTATILPQVNGLVSYVDYAVTGGALTINVVGFTDLI